MKKLLAIFAVIAMTSCGGSESTETVSSDSTNVKCDTTCVKDSTCVSDSTKKVETAVEDSTK